MNGPKWSRAQNEKGKSEKVCLQKGRPSSALWAYAVICISRAFWRTVNQPIATFPQLIIGHTVTHVALFQMVMLNQQFSQVSLLRNNETVLQINRRICPSDTTTHTNYTIMGHKQIQLVQQTGISWRFVLFLAWLLFVSPSVICLSHREAEVPRGNALTADTWWWSCLPLELVLVLTSQRLRLTLSLIVISLVS